MSATQSRDVFVACMGLVALVGMLFGAPVLLHMVQVGEVALLKAVPTVLGALLLLIGSLGLLMRRRVRGWCYAVAAIALLLGLFWLPPLLLSFWPWLAVLVACAGAIIGFRKGRGDEAAN